MGMKARDLNTNFNTMLISKNTARIFFVALVFITSFELRAQTVGNVSAKIDASNPSNVIITYNLTSSGPNQSYRIELRSSHDNYVGNLQMVSGDVGENVTPGNGLRIIWRAREEMGLFVGNITFEVNSTLTLSPLRLTSPRLSDTFDPGNSIPIEWEGGFSDSQIKLELFKSNLFNMDITTTPNRKKFDWVVPSDVLNGTDYKIKLYDTSAPADAVMSNNFTLNVITAAATQTKPTKEKKEKKGGGKAGWIIGGLAVAGGAAALYLTRDTGDEDAIQQQQFDDPRFTFPAPPGTPDGSTIQKRRGGLINFNISF